MLLEDLVRVIVEQRQSDWTPGVGRLFTVVVAPPSRKNDHGSESFARDISHLHFHRSSYATLRTRYSRRKGCWIEEGNRRVAERLKAAERLADDGRLEEAWNKVRLALERLYTIAMKAADPDFAPDQWRNATAEDMWKKGAGVVITGRVADAGTRLKDILTQSVKGAHDVSAVSSTDLKRAVDYVRTLLGPLQIGAG